MSDGLGAVCDDFHVSSRLFLKLEMVPGRETVLHFFDRLRKEYPRLRKLRRRSNGCLVLEEEPDDGQRRWVRLDADSLRFGHAAPDDLEDFRRFGKLVLEQAPFHLTFSDIDFDHIELLYGFDLMYQGNHDQLVAETLYEDLAVGGFLFGPHASSIIDAQPYFGIALGPECDVQAYVEVKSRTSTYEVRDDAYETQPITVLLTIRKYWSVGPPATLVEAFDSLSEIAEELAVEKVVPAFVNPLAAAIAGRS